MQPDEYRHMHAIEMRHWWFRTRRRLLVDLLRAQTRGIPRPRILDVGAGTGGNATAYAALGEVVGVEPDAGAIALARTRGGAAYCRAWGTALPFAPGSFDLVVASDVLEHIADDGAALREMHRVLRPEGRLVFTVPAHPWLFSSHDAALHHHRRYTRSALERVTAASGFRLERLSYWNFLLFPAVVAFRMLSSVTGGRRVQSDTGATPPWLDRALGALLAVELAALRRVSLPWGVSFVGIARPR